MRWLAKLPLLLILLLTAALGCVSAPPSGLSPDEERIHALLAEQRVPDFLDRLERAALRSAGHPRDGHLQEDERLRPRIESQLDPDAVMLDAVRRTARPLDPASLAEVERFYSSATGRKVLVALGAPYSWWGRVGYRLAGDGSPQPGERVALVERLYAETRVLEVTTDLYVRVYEGCARWYEARGMISPEEVEKVGGIDGLLAREREAVDAVSERHAVPFALYAYSDLSTPELLEYVTHMESEAGRAYGKAVREALVESIDARAATISR